MNKDDIQSKNDSLDVQIKKNYNTNDKENQHKKIFEISKQKPIKLNDNKKKEDISLIYSYSNYMSEFEIFNSNFETNIKDEKNDLKQKLFIFTKRGRKTKEDDSIRKHNKYTTDNLRRKCKYILINNILDFINEKIKEIYDSNIGDGMSKKELLPLNQKAKFEIGIEFNKKLLNKTIGEIFSDNISQKFTNYLPNHNQTIIQRLLNDKDEYKKNCLQKLFNITFLQCLKKFIGIESIEELDGLKTFYEINSILKEEPEYINTLKYYFLKFEENVKKERGKKNLTTKK